MVVRRECGVGSMSGALRRVLVRAPSPTGDFAAADWRGPDPELLAAQFEQFAALLAHVGCEVHVAAALPGQVDACYVRDPALMTPRGAVLFPMAKPVRRAESAALAEEFERCGAPVLGWLAEPARADGGDMVWWDSSTLLVGRGYRTNDAAIDQLSELLAAQDIRVDSVDVPHDRGPEHVLHLMSFLSPVAPDLAVVHLPLMPVRLVQRLRSAGVRLIDVDAAEHATMACNVLAVRPREVVLVEGNPRTEAALRAHGCAVHTYPGSEISVKGDGGPTCLTAPLWREPLA